MAVDVGTKRVGLAACDPSRTFVFPRGAVPRDLASAAPSVAPFVASSPPSDASTPAYPADVRAVRDLCREERAALAVLGLPLNVDGTEGPAAVAARAYGALLAAATNLPVLFVDERYTSMEADEFLRAQYRNPKERKARVDAAAATLILRTYLEHGAHPAP